MISPEYALISPPSIIRSVLQFSSVTQSCLTLCNPMDCSTPGLPVTNSRSLLKLMPLESVMSSNHLILCPPLLLLPSILPSVRVFSQNQFFASGGQSIGVSASASVLPLSTQDYSPLGWTGWISLQSKGLSSPAPQFESINSLVLSLLYGPTLTSIRDYWKNHTFD